MEIFYLTGILKIMKTKISYLDFANRFLPKFKQTDPANLKVLIDGMGDINHLKPKQIKEVMATHKIGLTYDQCRKFKELSKIYHPCEDPT